MSREIYLILYAVHLRSSHSEGSRDIEDEKGRGKAIDLKTSGGPGRVRQGK